ncbi:hypothetical protein SBADM41S_09547 [Streptomyces badius]
MVDSRVYVSVVLPVSRPMRRAPAAARWSRRSSTAARWSLSTQAVTGSVPAGRPSETTGSPWRTSSVTTGSWSEGSMTTVPSSATFDQTSCREVAGRMTRA